MVECRFYRGICESGGVFGWFFCGEVVVICVANVVFKRPQFLR